MSLLPFFVYGTLRPGCGNDHLWRGKAWCEWDGHASITGFRLITHGAFPYAVPELGERTVGGLVYPHEEHYDAVLHRFDMLEGVPHLYRRQEVIADVPDNSRPRRKAWVYTPAFIPDDCFVVPGNDWKRLRHPSLET